MCVHERTKEKERVFSGGNFIFRAEDFLTRKNERRKKKELKGKCERENQTWIAFMKSVFFRTCSTLFDTFHSQLFIAAIKEIRRERSMNSLCVCTLIFMCTAKRCARKKPQRESVLTTFRQLFNTRTRVERKLKVHFKLRFLNSLKAFLLPNTIQHFPSVVICVSTVSTVLSKR